MGVAMGEWQFFWLSALFACSINIPLAVLPFQSREAVLREQHHSYLSASTLYSLCMSGYMLAKAVSAPLMGRLSDTLGRREMLLVVLGGSAIGLELSAHCTTVWWIVLARVVTGTFSAATVVLSALAVDVAASGKEGLLYTRMSGGWALSCVLTPLVVFLADSRPSTCFHVSSAFAVVAALFVLGFVRNAKPVVRARLVRGANGADGADDAQAEDKEETKEATAQVSVLGTLRRICGDRMLLLMLLGDSLMPRQDLSRVVGDYFGGNAFVLSLEPCVGSLTRLVVPLLPVDLFRILSTTTDPFIVSVECVACGVIVMALPHSPTLGFFFLLVVVKGLVYTFFEPSKKAMISGLSRRHPRHGPADVGTFTGWTSFFTSLSTALSAFVGEWLASVHTNLPFWWAGLLFFVNAALLRSLARGPARPAAKSL